jgi:hypothetical protein
MKNQSSKPAAGEWSQLKKFRIYKDVFPGHQPTLGIFNNTRQQCIVRILLVGLDANNNQVTIPKSDLDKVELIDYASGEPLSRIDQFKEHPEWAYSTENQNYEWDESKIPGTTHASRKLTQVAASDDEKRSKESSSIDANEQVITYYVSTSSRLPKQIAARIRLRDSNTYFTTTAKVDDPDGEGNGSGSFNSYVQIRPVAFPSLPPENYGDIANGTLIPHLVGHSEYFYWATEYYLHVKLGTDELRLKWVSASAAQPQGFSVYKVGGLNESTKWGISYYGQPGDPAPGPFPMKPLASVDVLARGEDLPHIIYKPMDMFRTCAEKIHGVSSTRVVVGLLTGNLQARLIDERGYDVSPVTRMTLHIMDVYGNDHALSITFGSKVNELRLAKL